MDPILVHGGWCLKADWFELHQNLFPMTSLTKVQSPPVAEWKVGSESIKHKPGQKQVP